MSAIPQKTWTVDEYLAYERASDDKHEYLDGHVYSMVGGTATHNLICGNTIATLHAQLRKRPCYVYPSDMRIKVSRTGLYTYPDISVVCGSPEFDDEVEDTLVNPTVIIEVLSPSTESYDRGKKFQHYRGVASLQEYILIAQDSLSIEKFMRQSNGEWVLTDVTGMDAKLELPSIGCSLVLADVYEKVIFDDDQQ